MIQLRSATAADLVLIKEMVRQERLNPMGLKWERFLLAVSETGEVVGCGQIKSHKDGSHELASIVTRSDWRGQGVARLMIEQLMSEQTSSLWLMCRSSLAPFYEKFGFVEVQERGEMPAYFRHIHTLFHTFRWLSTEKLAIMYLERKFNYASARSTRIE